MILQEMRPFNVLSIRFLGAFCLLALLFYREAANITKRVLLSGMIIGLLYFITMALEMLALERADPSVVSILKNCAIDQSRYRSFIRSRGAPRTDGDPRLYRSAADPDQHHLPVPEQKMRA